MTDGIRDALGMDSKNRGNEASSYFELFERETGNDPRAEIDNSKFIG